MSTLMSIAVGVAIGYFIFQYASSSSRGATSGRLHKSSRDKKIAGVCGGLAECLGCDPTLIRIAWAVLAGPSARDWSKVTSDAVKLTVGEAMPARVLSPVVKTRAAVDMSVDAPAGALPLEATLTVKVENADDYEALGAAVFGTKTADVVYALDDGFQRGRRMAVPLGICLGRIGHGQK